MTYETGAAACWKLGVHRWRTGGPGWRDCDQCERCGQTRARRFSPDDIDMYDARDANREYIRADAEAHDSMSDNERDAQRGRPE